MVWRYREGEWVWNKSAFVPSFTLYLSLSSYTFLRLLSSYTFLLFSSQYLNSSSSFTVHAAYFQQSSVCVLVVCRSAGHKAFWCMIHHTFHYQSTKSDPAFKPIHYQTNWSLSKTSCHLICAPACSFHTHHHKPTKINTTKACQECRGNRRNVWCLPPARGSFEAFRIVHERVTQTINGPWMHGFDRGHYGVTPVSGR